MAASMATEGVINPIEIDKDKVIITGEMRWRAAKLAGLKTIPCKILDLKPNQRFMRQVIENIHHNTMSDWDTAKALEKLRQEVLGTLGQYRKHGGAADQGIKKLGRIIGKSPRYIIDHLEILQAPEQLQESIKTGKMKYTFLRALRRTPEEFKEKMEGKIINREFATRDSAIEVAVALQKNPEKAKEILAIDYRAYQTPAEVVMRLSKVSPRLSDTIRESYTPPKELTEIKNNLLDWVHKHPKHTLAPLHASRIGLTFTVMLEAMAEWASERKELND